ncbi:MAG: tRNA-dihydrouridine synthase family protein [Lachnospiraceae bacterium]|nr:tRNA-dihydrouridine synthase family protein [Lachnospiraceae bacterium]
MNKIYFAPMEGITTPAFRKVHKKYFKGIDKYFSPFIVVTSTHNLKKRETREYTPFEENMVPQILTTRGADFAWAAKMLKELGYEEVNLNLGCPAATVVTKRKGSGLLRDKDKLRKFFEETFAEPDLPDISIKTRCGFLYHEEAANLAEIFADFPFKEIIVHPRVREEFYLGDPNLESFRIIREGGKCPVIYNGDVFDVPSLESHLAEGGVMLGRGLLRNPMLAERKEFDPSDSRIESFLDELYDEYMQVMSGERDVLFKLKELWTYLIVNYPDKTAEYKRLMKSSTGADYKSAVRSILH